MDNNKISGNKNNFSGSIRTKYCFKAVKKKLSMVTLLYQGFALLMDQTGVDTLLVGEVILKPGMFPSSQTSLITHEKLILLFCSLYNTIMADFKESFLFP